MGNSGGGRTSKDDGRLGKDIHSTTIDNPGRIREFYDIEGRRLGEGSFATVFGAVNKSTGMQRAVKVCSKKKRKDRIKFMREIQMLKLLDHPNIIKYYESFQDGKYIYILMAICQGPELFDLTVKSGHLTEVETAVIMSQVFRAVTYMHSVGVCHRDLKMENFMLYKEEGDIVENSVRIIDYGLATRFDPALKDTHEPEVFTLKCGSPFYVSPQVLAGSYCHMTDLWSCGVLMYAMMAGYPPFIGGEDAEVLAAVRLSKYQFNAADWKMFTDDAKAVIRGLLIVNPRERLTGEKALQTRWIKTFAPNPTELPLKNSLIMHLQNFANANKLKRIGQYLIASNLTDEELKPGVDSFNMLDVEGDGSLGYTEIYNGLVRAGVSYIPDNLKEIFDGIDGDGSGQIEFTEFLAATLDRKYITEENVWSVFRIFDQNGDGKISQTEMYRTLNLRSEAEGDDDVSPQDVVNLMRETSQDGDTYCSFAELFAVMTGGMQDAATHKSSHKKSQGKKSKFATGPLRED